MKNLILIFFIISFSCFGHEKDSISTNTSAQIKKWVNNSSKIGFQENKGQFLGTNNLSADYILFKLEIPNLNIWITTRGLTYQFLNFDEKDKIVNKKGALDNQNTEWHRVDMILKDANILKENIMVYEEINRGDIKYILDSNKEISGVKSYRKIRISEIYSGIDWVLYLSVNGEIKYDFIVHANADPKQIKLLYEGSGNIVVNNNRIQINSPFGSIYEKELYCYQSNNQNEVSSKYSAVQTKKPSYLGAGIHKPTISQLNQNNSLFSYEVKIILGEYDKSKELIIDPQLVWATFYGGNNDDTPESIVTDIAGNLFVTGSTQSVNFPVQNAGSFYQGSLSAGTDIFLMKFDNNGDRLWATYYGGSANDKSFSLAIDSNSNLFVTGYTESANFPVLNAGTFFQGTLNGASDLFILKFDNSGNRLWSTYYGGSGSETAISISVDLNNNLLVTGNTTSANFPVQNTGTFYQGVNNGGRDVFVLKFDNIGTRLWATYYGGFDNESGNSIATDASGNIFITGSTTSPDFPVQNAGTFYQGTYLGGGFSGDVFILKFDALGNRIWATFYGGSGGDLAYSLAIDATNNLFVTGNTSSTNFPLFDSGTFFQGVIGGGGQDVYILKFDNVGNRLWATYFGGNGLDIQNIYDHIAIDNCGNINVSFITKSTDLSVQNTCEMGYTSNYNGSTKYNQYLTQFSNSGNLQWKTYLAGDGEDVGGALATDNQNSLFMAGISNSVTNSASYPLVNPGGGSHYDASWNGAKDAFLFKFEPTELQIDTIIVPACDPNCNGEIQLSPQNLVCNLDYFWSNGETTQSLNNLCIGNYNVTIMDSANCVSKSFNTIQVPNGCLLPTELLTFTATPTENRKVRLNWTTESEINNDYFGLENSIDGVTFDQFASRSASGNSSIAINYVHYDYNPYPSISYYRLKQVDFNGNYTYSSIVPVYFGNAIITNVYPNPAENEITVDIVNSNEGVAKISIINKLGQNVYSKSIDVKPGINKNIINVNSLATGIYTIILSTQNGDHDFEIFIKY